MGKMGVVPAQPGGQEVPLHAQLSLPTAILRLRQGLGPGLCDCKGGPGQGSPCPTPSVLERLTKQSLDHSFKTE